MPEDAVIAEEFPNYVIARRGGMHVELLVGTLRDSEEPFRSWRAYAKKGNPMPETAKKVEPKAPPPLADGGAATDPAVHQLLAERHTHVLNGDEKAAAAVTAQLAELGYK
jgi:hypothetical protein